jgi:hypothetical protein
VAAEAGTSVFQKEQRVAGSLCARVHLHRMKK